MIDNGSGCANCAVRQLTHPKKKKTKKEEGHKCSSSGAPEGYALSGNVREFNFTSKSRAETHMDLENYQKIQKNPKYTELVRKRSMVGWSLSLLMLVIYFGFILTIAYAPKFLGTPLGSGVMTVGIPIGLAVIISAFVLTGIYVAIANSTYDDLTRKIVEESR